MKSPASPGGRLIFPPAFGAQLASGAGSATKTPFMPESARAKIAAVGFFEDEIHKRFAAKRLGKPKSFCLVAPHQRGLYDEAAVHPEVYGKLHGLDSIVPAVGIARIIGFAHAAKDVFEAAPVGERRRKCQEQEISPGDKSIGQTRSAGFNVDVMRHCRLRDLPQGLDAHDVILAETVAPGGKIFADRFQDYLALAEFDVMSLAIIETDRLNELMTIERQGKTCRRILAAGKQDKRIGDRHFAALIDPFYASCPFMPPALAEALPAMPLPPILGKNARC
jgi:hypothetical protein